MRKARKSWARLLRVLGRERAKTKVLGMLLKVMVQAVIIFGLETGVMNHRMGQDLGGFQHRVDRRITGRQPCHILYGIWEYPPLEAAIQGAGFEEVEAYVPMRYNMVSQYIEMQPIL